MPATMGFGKFTLSIVSLLIIQTNSKKLTHIVEIHTGPIQGAILKNVLSKNEYSAFKGIPYSKPPLGKLRFLPPSDPDQWHEALQTIDHKSICAQITDSEFQGSEDCLYLNVYTPMIQFKKVEAKLRPVIVFIHGGAFITGSGNSEKYGPDFLVDKDVVLVTFNYRLGALGFLNLQHPEIPGNAGLKDQTFVLKWVKKNIAKFGGDPDNVTIFGQSAGAVSVDLHLVSDLSRDLFHKSIAMSGSAFCPWAFHTPDISRKNAFKLGENIRHKLPISNVSKLVELLQISPIKTLVNHTLSVLSLVEYMNLELPFAPSIEDSNTSQYTFLDECYLEKFKTGQCHKGPHILGFTNMEAAAAIPYLKKHFVRWWNKEGNNVVKDVENAVSTVKDWFETLWNQEKTRKKRNDFVNTILEKVTDELFTAGIDLKQRFMMKYGNLESIYYYFFTYSYKHNFIKGVGHSEDLLYVFYKPDNYQPLDYFEYKVNSNGASESAVVRDHVVTMFTNFAKYGNPTPDNSLNITWNKSNELGGYLEINKELVMHTEKRPISKQAVTLENERKNKYSKDLCVLK